MRDRRREWSWAVDVYYGRKAKLRRSGDLAISTVHRSQASAEFEAAAARDRPDIGRVVVTGPVNDGSRPKAAPEAQRD